MDSGQPGDVTYLLERVAEGDRAADAELAAVVQAKLHGLAAACMRGERADHSLQATALVNEAWLGLVGEERRRLGSRRAFFAYAAQVMRHALVDHARAHGAAKRGGRHRRLDFEVLLSFCGDASLDADHFLDLHQALEQLAQIDPRAARVIELRFFAGLTLDETAESLGVAVSTVESDFRTARAWLAKKLDPRQPK